MGRTGPAGLDAARRRPPAVVTSHKLRLYRAGAGPAHTDVLAELTHEVNTLVRTPDGVDGHAHDPLALSAVPHGDAADVVIYGRRRAPSPSSTPTTPRSWHCARRPSGAASGPGCSTPAGRCPSPSTRSSSTRPASARTGAALTAITGRPLTGDLLAELTAAAAPFRPAG
ncbi:hypothetical protein [Jiangella alba]|uniref:Uncharacterized protein n=1 Tax=Jiangella alba TaxID=561176 RepID=A0A1H5CF37_9ACTN|nr:hypothetical protein [Jiangella alba]SED65088.1 hypothetical protein SAMN04488561_0178 [Jiangella alba]